jgi:hypothetical protein
MFNFQTNAEEFFNSFNGSLMPNLKAFNAPLVVPGDMPASFLEDTLIPFFRTFSKMEQLFFQVTFLN